MDKKPLYNPLSNEFFYIWYDDDNRPHELIMPPGKVSYFPEKVADFMAKHLADEIIEVRKINPILPDKRKEVMNEITDISL
jgi:hypothetical protein